MIGIDSSMLSGIGQAAQQGGQQPPADPWLQAQQQAQQAAYTTWGQLPTGQAPYQADPGLIPQQNPGGGYNSGEDWAKAQQHAQAQSDARYGPAPGIGYKGQTGPYAPTADQPMAANYLTARPDQWAMNGSGPAIAPAMQQAVNEDPRLADLYSTLPVSKLNNIGNGFGVLPGALTPGVMNNNGGQMPAAFNELSKRTAQNPGAPPTLQNLGPWVAQAMAANPLQARKEGGGLPEGINPSGSYNNESYYDYSSPTGTAANSRGNQLATQQRQQAMGGNPQQQMLAQYLMGGGAGASMGVPTQVPQMGAAPMSMSAQRGPVDPASSGYVSAASRAAASQPGGGFSYSPPAGGQPPSGPSISPEGTLSALAGVLQGVPVGRSAGTPEQALGAKLRQLNNNSGLLGLGAQQGGGGAAKPASAPINYQNLNQLMAASAGSPAPTGGYR